MIVKTRYRDLSWKDTGCPSELLPQYRETWELKVRGRTVFVETPSHSNLPLNSRKCEFSNCDQPKYRVVNEHGVPVIANTGNLVSVCPHIAEIGD